MLTKNYRSFKALAMIYKDDDSHTSSSLSKTFSLTNTNNKIYSAKYNTASIGPADSSTVLSSHYAGLNFRNIALTKSEYTSGGAGAIFGNGTTPPTEDDYKLSGDIVTGYTSSGTASTEIVGSQIIQEAVYTLTNTSSSDITISEVGYVGRTSSSTAHYFLLDRTLLDSPVTIPAGGVGQVTYTITFNIA